MRVDPSPEQVPSPEGLALSLFDGALRAGAEALDAVRRDDDDRAAELVGRVRSIVLELDRGLNPAAGAVTRHLGALLEYALQRLESDRHDERTLGAVVADLRVLREAWTALVADRLAGERAGIDAPALAR